MESSLILTKSENCNSQVLYQKLIGSLMNLVVMTRPDISYCINLFSKFNNSYKNNALAVCKKNFKVFKGNKKLLFDVSEG